MSETGAAFRAALDDYLTAQQDATAALGDDDRYAEATSAAMRAHRAMTAAAVAHVSQLPAGTGEVPSGLADLHRTVHTGQSAHVNLIRSADEAVATHALMTEYERLRDDTGTDRECVHAAAQELATARMAHRAAAGLPVISGAGG